MDFDILVFFFTSAAHCVHEDILDKKNWQLTGARLGEWNLLTSRDCDYSQGSKPICSPPVVDHQIEKVIIHDNFVAFDLNLLNDIALLLLRGNVEFNDFVKPICLPLSTNNIENFNDVSMIVAGFGRTEDSDSSKIKLKTEIRGISNQKCREFYALEPQTVLPSQMCALGERGKDSW